MVAAGLFAWLLVGTEAAKRLRVLKRTRFLNVTSVLRDAAAANIKRAGAAASRNNHVYIIQLNTLRRFKGHDT